MKIGIFNEHFNTMGGGEKHVGAIAEYFSSRRKHEIQLISFDDFDLNDLEQKLNLDLSGCSVVLLDNHYQVEEFSKTYDVFINASYQSTIKPKAKKNIILIFFPVIPRHKLIAKSLLAQKIIKLTNRCLDEDSHIYQSGFYPFERTGRRAGHWTRQNFSIKAKTSFKNQPVDLILELAPISQLEFNSQTITAGVCNGSVPEMIKCEPKRIVFRLQSLEDGQLVSFLLKETFKPDDDPRNLGIFIEQIEIRPAQDHAKSERENAAFIFFRKNVKKIPLLRSAVRYLITFRGSTKNSIFSPALLTTRIGRFFTRQVRDYDYLEYYDLILTNSEYTRKWIKKYWSRESKILYPRIDVDSFFNDRKKEKVIISVGRFFKGGHSKKQLAMVKIFKKMIDEGLQNWEYHLCGGTHQGRLHQEYLDAIREESKGYPVFIHADMPFTELKDLYARSSIFWHAAGLGEDENKDPDKFEHFGITTVEAMAAGCIPIVINKAGQKEIVTEGENGFLWDKEDELKRKTKFVAEMPADEKSRIRENAITRSKYFSRDSFNAEVKRLFNLD